MAAPMPKSVSFPERIETVWKTKVAYEYAYTFYRQGGHVFIVAIPLVG